jgi:hypothetical protein
VKQKPGPGWWLLVVLAVAVVSWAVYVLVEAM